MKKGRLKEQVASILEQYPVARDDDNYLYYLVISKSNHYKPNMTFKEIMFDDYFPRYETISRLRRYIQRIRKDLQATEEVQKLRYEQEIEVRKEMKHAR